MSKPNKLIDQQIKYYQARANEYDEWFLRQGRYDRGPDINHRWFKESAKPKGSILELACGTGLWTQLLMPFAAQITAVDSSKETIALNKVRLKNNRVQYHIANIFNFEPEKKYDFIFFGFWLSHVPPEKFESFWDSIRSYLNPLGRVFFIDSLHAPASAAKDHQYPKKSQTIAKRRLNNGREYEIIKVFYEPEELENKLLDLGWDISVMKTKNYFLFGTGKFR
ncbi:MAG: class I SAM-dependent methyltransferase [Deltaproteobacteria bacterium]|nr:class I SAM-dependent methyltransferase [Deltaproteobacteria bacterium]